MAKPATTPADLAGDICRQIGADPNRPPALLTPSQREQIDGTPIASQANQRLRGDGPPFTKIGRHVRYPLSAYLAYLASRTVHHTGELKMGGR